MVFMHSFHKLEHLTVFQTLDEARGIKKIGSLSADIKQSSNTSLNTKGRESCEQGS